MSHVDDADPSELGDVIATIPLLAGFIPHESLVILGFADATIGSRVDWAPNTPGFTPAIEHTARRLLAAGADLLGLVFWTTSPNTEPMTDLVAHLNNAGLPITLAMRFDDHHIFDLVAPDADPVPLDLATHPLTRLAPTPPAGSRTEVQARFRLGDTIDPDLIANCTPDMVPTTIPTLGSTLSDTELGELIGVASTRAGFEVLMKTVVSAGFAAFPLEWWTDVVSRSPRVLEAADWWGLCAFGVWLTGRGNAAWDVVEIAHEHGLDTSFLASVCDALVVGADPRDVRLT